MIEQKKTILIIENQRAQFTRMGERLDGFDIFPRADDYDNFMEWVRCWANPGYNLDRKDKVLGFINAFIKDNKIQLIILDYKLSGTFEAATGIYLAQAISIRYENMPILYFSRSPYSSLSLYHPDIASFVKEEDWIEKGTDMELLGSYYYDKHLKEKINKHLGAIANGDHPKMTVNDMKSALSDFFQSIERTICKEYLRIVLQEDFGVLEEELVVNIYTAIFPGAEIINFNEEQILDFFRQYEKKKVET